MSEARELLLENPKTGAVRPFRDGFDWILFLFSGVLGLPLFLQGLPLWGASLSRCGSSIWRWSGCCRGNGASAARR